MAKDVRCKKEDVRCYYEITKGNLAILFVFVLATKKTEGEQLIHC